MMYYLVLFTDPAAGALVYGDASRDLRFAARTVRDHEPDSPLYTIASGTTCDGDYLELLRDLRVVWRGTKEQAVIR